MNETERKQLLADVEGFCQKIRDIEELCYVEHQFNDQLVPLAKKYNILGMPVPKEYGGRGADTVTYVRALARINQEGTGVRTFFSGHTSIGEYPIMTWGSEAQKQKYLPPACKGEKIMAFGLTEPEAGSNPLEMQMTYERKGNKFVLNGVKYLISNAGIASTVIAFAYPLTPNPSPPPGRGEKESPPQGRGEKESPLSTSGGEGQGVRGRISAFIVDMDGPGCEREDLTAKMGMPTANTGMFELTNYEVPLENMLGEEGQGFRIAMGTLVSGRLSVAAGCLGVIEDCLKESITWAKQRHQHGKEIARHQLVQEHLAHIEMHRVSTEALLLRAAEAKDASNAEPGNKELSAKADLLAAQVKLFASNAAWDAADRAVQIYGGRGWSTLYRPGRHLQDVRVCRIYEGTDEILKLKVAAAVLGKEYEAFK